MQSSATTACRRCQIATNSRSSLRRSRRSSDGARRLHLAHRIPSSRMTCTMGTSSPRALSSWQTFGEYSSACDVVHALLLTTARKALHARPRSLQGPHGVQPGASDREAWQARRARSVHFRIWLWAPVSLPCGSWPNPRPLTSSRAAQRMPRRTARTVYHVHLCCHGAFRLRHQ